MSGQAPSTLETQLIVPRAAMSNLSVPWRPLRTPAAGRVETASEPASTREPSPTMDELPRLVRTALELAGIQPIALGELDRTVPTFLRWLSDDDARRRTFLLDPVGVFLAGPMSIDAPTRHALERFRILTERLLRSPPASPPPSNAQANAVPDRAQQRPRTRTDGAVSL